MASCLAGDFITELAEKRGEFLAAGISGKLQTGMTSSRTR